MSEYKELEEFLMFQIAAAYDLTWPEPNIVRETDRRILRDEFEQNMHNPSKVWDLPTHFERLGIGLNFWEPREAERVFLGMFHRLNEERNGKSR